MQNLRFSLLRLEGKVGLLMFVAVSLFVCLCSCLFKRTMGENMMSRTIRLECHNLHLPTA